jgi:hypothetical protein
MRSPPVTDGPGARRRRQRAAFAEDLRRQQFSRRRGGGDAQPFMAQRQPYTAARGMRANQRIAIL